MDAGGSARAGKVTRVTAKGGLRKGPWRGVGAELNRVINNNDKILLDSGITNDAPCNHYCKCITCLSLGRKEEKKNVRLLSIETTGVLFLILRLVFASHSLPVFLCLEGSVPPDSW